MLTRDNEIAILVIMTSGMKFIKILTLCEIFIKKFLFIYFSTF